MRHICRLCNHEMSFFSTSRQRDYYRCSNCDSIQLDQNMLLDHNSEKYRYELHNNDIDDPGYQKFVKPITSFVLDNFNSKDKGLDFGAGPGPVISKVLKDHGYDISQYDPYFHPNDQLLKQQYLYVIACEVIEHFNQPKNSFDILYKVLAKGGSWIFMTELYNDHIDFSHWYYKNDETHVIFYTEKTLQYLKDHYGFSDLITNKRLVIFIQ